MERTNVLKRSQHNLMSIIRSSTHWQFNANSERLLVAARCSTALSRFGVVLSKIPKYLKVCTCSIMSPSNTNSWHGSIELNTTTFVFFMFTVSPRSAQNCWSASNCYCYPTSDSDVRTRSFAKNNNHTCTSVKVGASHSLPSKRPSRASKCSPNNRGLKGQPCFTPCWHLKLEVTPSFGWLIRMVSLAYIAYRHYKKRPSTPRPANTCHNTSHGTISNTFLRSTKQQYSGFFFALLCSIRVRNMKSWSVMR